MSDIQVQAEIRLKDNLSKAAASALDTLQKSAKATGAATDAIGKGEGMRNVSRDAADAARSMDAVGREARQTQQHIRGAERGGQALARSLSRVRDAGRDAARHMATMGKAIPAVGGGIMAAGYVGRAAMEKPMAYEAKLLDMANAAYSDHDYPERRAGIKKLNAAIVDAVRSGGGSRDSAADALNTLLAAGTDEGVARQLLPVIQKAATASGAGGGELASILVKGINQKQFTADEARAAIDKAIKAGQAGQFELRDMARWLPQIISAGKGMKGMKGYEAHLANLQGIANVTGSSDQAGNAYFNLLSKITSQDTTRNFKKMGVNLPKELARAAQEGMDPVTAFAQLVEKKVIGKSKQFKALQKQIAATKDKGEKQALMEQAADILQGGAMGRAIPDRIALLGLAGILTQQDVIGDVREQLQHADGAADISHRSIASSTAYKMQQLSNEKDIAMSATLDKIKGPLDASLDAATRLAQQNPAAATATAGAATAGSMAAAGGATVSVLQGGSAVAGAAKAGEMLARGSAKAAPVLGLGLSAFEIYRTETDDALSREQKNKANMETYGGFGGMLAGAAMGGMAGSAVPVLGTAAGALLGGIIGYFSGGKAGKATGEMIWSDDAQAQQVKQLLAVSHAQQTPQAEQPLAVEQTINLTVELDGDRVAAAVERRQSRESLRR